MKSNLADLQEAMKDMPQADCPVEHYFSDGIYARQLTIPAGVCIVGAKHKTNHLLMFVSGTCLVSDNGQEAVRVEAPFMTETKAGTKRAITALTDTTMTTFHVTEETDVLKIGDEILEKDYNGLPGWMRQLLEVKK